MPNIKELLERALIEQGYDGLTSDYDDGCACVVGKAFMNGCNGIIDDATRCEAGYRYTCEQSGCKDHPEPGFEHPFHIGTEKPPEA